MYSQQIKTKRVAGLKQRMVKLPFYVQHEDPLNRYHAVHSSLSRHIQDTMHDSDLRWKWS